MFVNHKGKKKNKLGNKGGGRREEGGKKIHPSSHKRRIGGRVRPHKK
jgi:hypothetical protein